MQLDRVILPIKLGDKKSANGITDGMPVGYISEREWGLPIDKIISPECRRIFGMVEYTEKDIPYLTSIQKPNGKESDCDIRFARNKIDMKQIPSNVLSDWRDANKVKPIISKNDLISDIFKDTKTLSAEKVVDKNAIAGGTATFGAGSTYATSALAFADIAAALTSTLRFNRTSATTETAESAITENIGVHSFIVNNGTHLGNPNSGYLITRNFDGHLFNYSHTGAGVVENFGANIITTFNLTAGYADFRLNSNTSATVSVYNLLSNRNGKRGRVFLNLPATANNVNFYDSMVWGGGITDEMIYIFAGGANVLVENCSIYNCVEALDGGGVLFTARNLALLGNTTDYANIGAATGRNNADSDGTAANGNWNVGTNNQINQVSAAQWQSLVAADGDTFLLPVDGSTIDNDGLLPVYATTLINGTPWVSEIGAKGIIPTPSTGVTSQNHTAIHAGFGLF